MSHSVDKVPADRKQRCHLLELPPELRNQIYDHVATSTRTISVHEGALVPHALARTCKQIRSESIPVFESESIFYAHTIKARVIDLDFTNLTTFIEDYEWPHRTLNVKLKITKADLSEIDTAPLRKGLVYCFRGYWMATLTSNSTFEFDSTQDPNDVRTGMHDLIEGILVLEDEGDDGLLHEAVDRAAFAHHL